MARARAGARGAAKGTGVAARRHTWPPTRAGTAARRLGERSQPAGPTAVVDRAADSADSARSAGSAGATRTRSS